MTQPPWPPESGRPDLPAPYPPPAPVSAYASSAPWPPGPPYAPTPVPYGYAGYPAPYAGAIGRIRGTGVCILLTVVTLGIYPLVWYYQVHAEMKRHSGQGIDGVLALVLAFFVGIVMPFITSSEVGELYARRGWAKPVSGLTGLWALLLGWFFFVGAIIWFVQTNGALNAYWRSMGAR